MIKLVSIGGPKWQNTKTIKKNPRCSKITSLKNKVDNFGIILLLGSFDKLGLDVSWGQ